MSRIGKAPVELNEKTQATITASTVTLKGPLGELSLDYRADQVKVEQVENTLVVTPLKPDFKAMWGTTRSVLANMAEWVNTEFKKSLEINGVGYKIEVQGQKITLSIGFSHKVEMEVPTGVTAKNDEKIKNVVHFTGIDKQLVGEFAAKVRAKKKPEPYKGKGIKYVGEHIIRKAGKTGAK